MESVVFIVFSLLSSCESVSAQEMAFSGFSGEGSQLGDDTEYVSSGPVKVFDEELVDCCNIFKTEKCGLSCDCESLVALNDSECEFVDGDTVLFKGLTLEVQLNTSQGLPVVCANFSQNATVSGDLLPEYPIGFNIIAYVGGSLSIIGCSLVFVTFILFKELHTFPAKIVLHIATAILLGNVFYFVGVGVVNSSELCDAVAISLHFLTLAQLSWMTVMCFEVCQSFYHASRLIPVRVEGTRCKLVAYSIVAWGVPLLIVAVSIVVNYTTPLVQYDPYAELDSKLCWITDFLSGLVAFCIPVGVLVMLQLILSVVGGFYLVKSSRNRSNAGLGKKNTPYLRVVLAMFSASSLVWILAILAYAMNIIWVWYLFVILNSTQGIVLFFAFYGTRKVLKLYISKFKLTILVSPSDSSYRYFCRDFLCV